MTFNDMKTCQITAKNKGNYACHMSFNAMEIKEALQKNKIKTCQLSTKNLTKESELHNENKHTKISILI